VHASFERRLLGFQRSTDRVRLGDEPRSRWRGRCRGMSRSVRAWRTNRRRHTRRARAGGRCRL